MSDGLGDRILSDILADAGKMPLGAGLAMLDELLQYVGENWHREGAADGGLDPTRVFLGDDGRVRVLPVGVTPPDADAAAYLSPQQREGKDADARADVYALGVIAYRALTGALPYAPGATEPTDPRVYLPKLTDLVRDSLLIAVQENLTERFGDALTFRAAIRGDSGLALASPTLKWAVAEGIPEGDTGAAEEFADEAAAVQGGDAPEE